MRPRILALFLVILSLPFVYIYFRILAPLRVWPPFFLGATLGIALLFAGILWLPLVFWASREAAVSPREQSIERFAHVAMGYVSFLLFVTVVRDLALAVLRPLGHASLLRGPGISLDLLALAAGLALVGFFIARSGPRIRRVNVSSEPGTANGIPPLRAVQISDLHVGTWIGHRYVERVATDIRALGPIDFLFLTGDIGDGDPKEHVADIAPLGKIEARLGKFAVSGNHEGYWDEAEWNTRIRELGFRVLENESVEVKTPQGTLTVAGISDAGADPARALAGVRPDRYSIFLAHQPKHAPAAIAAGVRLQLSGHTHAGQFIPWSLLVRFFHRFAYGLHRVGPTAIYVNRGTGFWGPPFRLGTRSETTLLEFSPTAT